MGLHVQASSSGTGKGRASRGDGVLTLVDLALERSSLPWLKYFSGPSIHWGWGKGANGIEGLEQSE